MGGQQAPLLSLAGGEGARRAKSGLGCRSTAKGRGMTPEPETRGTRPPGGNDLVELGLGRSIGHKRVPRKVPRRDPLSSRSLDVHYGMDGHSTVNNTSEAAVGSLAVVADDAVEKGGLGVV